MTHRIETEMLLERVEETLDFYRGNILDLVAQRLDGDPGWPVIRGLILRALGDRGLSKRFKELIIAYANSTENSGLSKGEEK